MRIGHLLDGPFLKGKNYEILYSSFTSRALNLDSELTALSRVYKQYWKWVLDL